jgi:hypothetical protein
MLDGRLPLQESPPRALPGGHRPLEADSGVISLRLRTGNRFDSIATEEALCRITATAAQRSHDLYTVAAPTAERLTNILATSRGSRPQVDHPVRKESGTASGHYLPSFRTPYLKLIILSEIDRSAGQATIWRDRGGA